MTESKRKFLNDSSCATMKVLRSLVLSLCRQDGVSLTLSKFHKVPALHIPLAIFSRSSAKEEDKWTRQIAVSMKILQGSQTRDAEQ